MKIFPRHDRCERRLRAPSSGRPEPRVSCPCLGTIFSAIFGFDAFHWSSHNVGGIATPVARTWMVTGRGDLRFRPWPSLLRLPESSRQSHGARWLSREGWRLSRFYPSRDYLMPVHEYPRALRRGLSG